MAVAIFSACSFKQKATEKPATKPKVEKPRDLPKPTRKRHKFGDHLILDRLMTYKSTVTMV